jgi:hypothetical protein
MNILEKRRKKTCIVQLNFDRLALQDGKKWPLNAQEQHKNVPPLAERKRKIMRSTISDLPKEIRGSMLGWALFVQGFPQYPAHVQNGSVTLTLNFQESQVPITKANI